MKQLLFVLALLSINAAFAQDEQSKEAGSPNFVSAPRPPEIVNGNEVCHIPDEPAQFPGGMVAMRQFLSANMVYPQRAVDEGLQGKCYVTFIVTSEGDILQPVVQKGVPRCPECDAESLRIISIMPKWMPATHKDKPVYSRFNLPFYFKLAE